MIYECENCKHHFTDREARCEDWRVKGKDFICPSCETPLAKPTLINSIRQDWKKYLVMGLIYGITPYVGMWVLNNTQMGMVFLSFIVLLLVVYGYYAFKNAKPVIVRSYNAKNM